VERLIAWDPVNQKQVWSIPHKGLWNGGVLTTSTGLVFEGTSDGMLSAFDADNGKILWQKDLGTGAVAPPVMYQVGDTVYVSIAVGWGGAMGLFAKFTKQINPGTVYTFALNRNTAMPAYKEQAEKKLIDMPFTATPAQIQHGGLLFTQYCITCHSVADGGGSIPDLGYSSEATHKIFNDIVLKRLYANKGMPDFSGKLAEQDATDIHNFILATAKQKAMKK
jgi:quinohemoprotein ethanol dehydrogenase